MQSLTIILAWLHMSISSIVGVEIREMHVPAVIESGSHPHIILDCDYDLSLLETEQLDVKWFFNNDPQPFFQWLPGRPPQTVGELFRNRLDLSYSVQGAHKYKKHRALKILHPTAELSGLYKCKVSSFVDEDFMQKKMIVYSPASNVRLTYSKLDYQTINLTCSAFGLYPEPEVKLSWGPLASDHGETTTLTVESEGRFDVSVHKILSEDLLKPETVFGCLVTIPGTSYSVKEETMYFPGQVLYQITAGKSPLNFGPLILTSALLVGPLWEMMIRGLFRVGLPGLLLQQPPILGPGVL